MPYISFDAIPHKLSACIATYYTVIISLHINILVDAIKIGCLSAYIVKSMYLEMPSNIKPTVGNNILKLDHEKHFLKNSFIVTRQSVRVLPCP